MHHTGRANRTLMGAEWVCGYCWRSCVAVDPRDMLSWPVAQEWSLQDSADFYAHKCEGELAQRVAKKIEEALWRQDHAKKIRRRV